MQLTPVERVHEAIGVLAVLIGDSVAGTSGAGEMGEAGRGHRRHLEVLALASVMSSVGVGVGSGSAIWVLNRYKIVVVYVCQIATSRNQSGPVLLSLVAMWR